MPASPTRWIKRCAEFQPKSEAEAVPLGTRGIYALFRHRRIKGCYDVVYVGLSKTGMRGRLRSHKRSRTKAKVWSHFSVFEVFDNVTESEIAELEGIFRHIYRHDSKANRLNIQKTHRPLRRVRMNDLSRWTKA